MLETILNVIEASAIVLGAGVAAYGVDSWRRQLVGGKRAEIAEEALAKFYEAREIIAAARSVAGYAAEGRSRRRGANETEDLANYLDSLYVPVERLRAENEFLHLWRQ
jgi:gamma-glutamylcysteine synthetase